MQKAFFRSGTSSSGPSIFRRTALPCAAAPRTQIYKESCEEGIGAAMRVSIPMKNEHIEAEGIVADIDLTNCNVCGLVRKCLTAPSWSMKRNNLRGQSPVQGVRPLCGDCQGV